MVEHRQLGFREPKLRVSTDAILYLETGAKNVRNNPELRPASSGPFFSCSFGSLVSAEERLRCERALRIAYQHPAQWHRRQTFVLPDGGTGADLDDLVALALTK
jgi:hypothetical protein